MAVNPTYQTKVYEDAGGDEIVVASGGKITVQSGGAIVIESGGTGVSAHATQAHVTDVAALTYAAPAVTSAQVTPPFASLTAAGTAYNQLQTDLVATNVKLAALAVDLTAAEAKLNAVLVVLETATIVASS